MNSYHVILVADYFIFCRRQKMAEAPKQRKLMKHSFIPTKFQHKKHEKKKYNAHILWVVSTFQNCIFGHSYFLSRHPKGIQNVVANLIVIFLILFSNASFKSSYACFNILLKKVRQKLKSPQIKM